MAMALKTQNPVFAHPSESEFAQILDFYGVECEYEPRSFPKEFDGDRVVEMFTRGFYLSQINLYIELTTLKQSLVTKKNRKLRLIRELNPEIRFRLLYRRDFHRLLAKFGFGPLASSDTPVASASPAVPVAPASPAVPGAPGYRPITFGARWPRFTCTGGEREDRECRLHGDYLL